MMLMANFRGSPLQNFFPSCPRTNFYCASGMLTPPGNGRYIGGGNSIRSRATEVNFLTPMNTSERG